MNLKKLESSRATLVSRMVSDSFSDRIYRNPLRMRQSDWRRISGKFLLLIELIIPRKSYPRLHQSSNHLLYSSVENIKNTTEKYIFKNYL